MKKVHLRGYADHTVCHRMISPPYVWVAGQGMVFRPDTTTSVDLVTCLRCCRRRESQGSREQEMR
jgi:hypothetical protein